MHLRGICLIFLAMNINVMASQSVAVAPPQTQIQPPEETHLLRPKLRQGKHRPGVITAVIGSSSPARVQSLEKTDRVRLQLRRVAVVPPQNQAQPLEETHLLRPKLRQGKRRPRVITAVIGSSSQAQVQSFEKTDPLRLQLEQRRRGTRTDTEHSTQPSEAPTNIPAPIEPQTQAQIDSSANSFSFTPPEGISSALTATEAPSSSGGLITATIDDAIIDGGPLVASDAAADAAFLGVLKAGALVNLNPNWQISAKARVEGRYQPGSDDFADIFIEPADVFLRFRNDTARATLGYQKAVWGRLDFDAPNDLLSVTDGRRAREFSLLDRRVSTPAARLELFKGDYKLDVLVTPFFQAARLPEEDDIWSPIDREGGRILGAPTDAPLVSFLAANGNFEDDESGFGGGGVRLSHTGRGFDYALTAQGGRPSLPVFELNSAVAAALGTGVSPGVALAAADGPTFVGRHPFTGSFGADASTAFGSVTLRTEAAFLTDAAATRQADLAVVTGPSVDAGLSLEYLPDGLDLALTTQVNVSHRFDDEITFEPATRLFVNGLISKSFARERWETRLSYNIGVLSEDYYVSPELVFKGFSGSEFSLVYFFFEGEPTSFGGFFDANDMVVLRWRLRN